MIGKTVKSNSPELILFMYPGFTLRNTIVGHTNRLLYNGPMRNNLLQTLRNHSDHYISVTGKPDIIFDSREAIIQFIASRSKRRVGKQMMKSLESLSDTEFINFAKSFWVLGRYPTLPKVQESVFDYYQSFLMTKEELIRRFFMLLDSHPFSFVEAVTVTLFQKVMTLDDIHISATYQSVLERLSSRLRGRVDSQMFSYMEVKNRGPLDLLLLIIGLVS